ncbi:hypothetical protein REPUB_Repub03eG0102500 [Reevesia pubescens]
MEESVISLLNLLQDDVLILDRFIVGCYTEMPLHVASLLGHVEFVDQLLTLKPELAKELDVRKASPLHLATSKTTIKGHIIVLEKLVQAKPQTSQMLTNESETILHICVRYNQLEAMEFLVEIVGDHEFLNSKNSDGNTI